MTSSYHHHGVVSGLRMDQRSCGGSKSNTPSRNYLSSCPADEQKKIRTTLHHEEEEFQRKHLSKVQDAICQGCLPTPQDSPDWQAFLRDLQACPALALGPLSPKSAYPLLFVVILVPTCPLSVVQVLLDMNPRSVKERCHNHGWNILQWIVWFATNQSTTNTVSSSNKNNSNKNNNKQQHNHRIVSPAILKELLCRYPEAVTQYDPICQCTPLESFLDHDPSSEQFRTILETLPETTAILLLYHYLGEVVLTPQVLDLALSNAEQWERDGICVYEMKVTYSVSCPAPLDEEAEETVKTTSLMSEMVKRLSKRNLVLFHRYLQGFVKGRAAHLRDDYIHQDFGQDKLLSLQTCVYYALARIDLGSLPLLRGEDDSYYYYSGCDYGCEDDEEDDEEDDNDYEDEEEQDSNDMAWGNENLRTWDSPLHDEPPLGGFGMERDGPESEEEDDDDDEEEDGADLVMNARSFVRRVCRAFDDALKDPKYKQDAQSIGVQGAEDALLALRMGYQWDRLKICFDWENLLHARVNGLLPFLMAASAVEKQRYSSVMGFTYTKKEYEADDGLNALNNTFELLRMDSTVIQCATRTRPAETLKSKQEEAIFTSSVVQKANRKRKANDAPSAEYGRGSGKR